MRKKVIALILVVVMLVAAVPTALAANEYDDIQGHWGQAAIDRWIQAGVAEGREDGSFAPNEAMTREEAARMFVCLLHLTREADVSQYTDLDPNSPYYSDIAKCVAAGIFTGTSDHTMSSSAELTREQLFTTFARALGIQSVSTSSVTFVDGAKVSDWAEGYINALANMGAVRGVSAGSLLPQDDINRASVMAVLNQAISVYADTNGVTVGESDGIVLVVADQVSVMGDVQNLVVAGGSASVSGGTVANASLVGEAAELNVSGNAVVAEIAVNSEGSQLNVSGRAQVGSVTVACEATGTVVNVNDTAAVNTITSQADGVTIAGSGTVNSAVMSGNNTAVNTNGTNLTVSLGTTGVTENGSAVSGGATVETAPGTPSTPSNPVIPSHVHSYTVTEIKAVDAPEVTVVLQYTCYAGDHSYVELNENAQASIGSNYYADLNNALANGGTVDLLKDVTSSNSFKINGNAVVLNLNGHTVSASGYDGAIYAVNGAQVTINGDGAVIGNDDRNYAMAVWATGAGTQVIINGGTYMNNFAQGHTDDQMDMIYASDGGTITINGGTFNCITPQWTLNVRDADYQKNPDSIQVTGGTFKNYNPAQSVTENPVADYVADGYKVTPVQDGEDTWYTVAPLTAESAEAMVSGRYYEKLTDAISALKDGETLALCRDVTLDTATTAILFNIPGKLNIENSTIKGAFHEIIARGGDVTIANSIIDNQLPDAQWADPSYSEAFLNGNWCSGNSVPLTALVVGNRSTAYQYPTHCTLINTNITVGESQRTVYVYGNATAELGAYLTYDESSNVGNVVVGGGYVSINNAVVSPLGITD